MTELRDGSPGAVDRLDHPGRHHDVEGTVGKGQRLHRSDGAWGMQVRGLGEQSRGEVHKDGPHSRQFSDQAPGQGPGTRACVQDPNGCCEVAERKFPLGLVEKHNTSNGLLRPTPRLLQDQVTELQPPLLKLLRLYVEIGNIGIVEVAF